MQITQQSRTALKPADVLSNKTGRVEGGTSLDQPAQSLNRQDNEKASWRDEVWSTQFELKLLIRCNTSLKALSITLLSRPHASGADCEKINTPGL